MAIDRKQKREYYTTRYPYNYQAEHFNDNYKNLGYNYKGNILKNTTSPELWSNPLQRGMIGQLEVLLEFLIEYTKSIKKTFSIAHNKDADNI